LAIGVLYFGLLQSRVGGGRTLGMRLLGLQVRAVDGGLLGVGAAALRAVVLLLPLTLNGIMLARSPLNLAAVYVSTVVIFGGCLAQLYLLIFNRPSRRLLHDLVARSVVLKVGRDAAPPAVSQKHLIATGACFALAAAVPAVLAAVPKPKWLLDLEPAHAAVEALPEVRSATMERNWSEIRSFRGPAQKIENLVVTVRLREQPSNYQAEAARIAATARARFSGPPDLLRVQLVNGYNMGLASSYRTQGAAFQGPINARPDWLRKPTPQEVSRYYPPDALRRHVTGSAHITCEVELAGQLSGCSVYSEDPAGYGFGNAALAMTPAFRMAPAIVNNMAERSRITVPVAFNPTSP
jgi:TonB family protein